MNYQTEGKVKFDKLDITHCGQPMRPMGLWPNKDFSGGVSKYHCTNCNEYVSVIEPDVKLQAQP